ncbi:hypothetical protein HZS_7081 [Henneguya salminicola]|nr:hypothetical protein HZS_7081 [Henneguya salminicola]
MIILLFEQMFGTNRYQSRSVNSMAVNQEIEVAKPIEINQNDDSGNEAGHETEEMNKDSATESKLAGKRTKMSRNEKKTRKAFSKLGLKLITGIDRIVLKKSKQVLFCLDNPDVYKSTTSDTYIVFGDVKVDDFGQQAQAKAVQNLKDLVGEEKKKEQNALVVEGPPSDDDEIIEQGNLTNIDIEMVMTQAACSKNKAIRALKENNADHF